MMCVYQVCTVTMTTRGRRCRVGASDYLCDYFLTRGEKHEKESQASADLFAADVEPNHPSGTLRINQSDDEELRILRC